MVVDETFLTVRKYNFGRQTAGTTLKLIGMVELDPTRRRETGLCKLVIIPDLKKETFKAFIKPNVIPGSTIFTDSHKSYQWMRSEGFDHHWVNHKRREFSRREGSMIISTNAIEGVWSRVKKLLRTYKVSRPANMDHELYFLEYVWRSRYLRGHGEHGEWSGMRSKLSVERSHRLIQEKSKIEKLNFFSQLVGWELHEFRSPFACICIGYNEF